HWLSELSCQPRHAGRRFPFERLPIQTPFSCNHQVRVFHLQFKPDCFCDNFESRPDCRAAKTQQTEAETAGGARTRLVPIVEPKPQSARHAKTAIVRRAAPQPDDDFVRTAFGRIQNHFAHTERSRTNWIAFSFGKPPHASGFAHLHYCEFFLIDPSVVRLDFAAERIVRIAFQRGTAARITNRSRGPPSA